MTPARSQSASERWKVKERMVADGDEGKAMSRIAQRGRRRRSTDQMETGGDRDGVMV